MEEIISDGVFSMSRIKFILFALMVFAKVAADCPTVTSVSTSLSAPLQPYMPARTITSPTIYITGTGFTTATEVYFGNVPLLLTLDFDVTSDSLITVLPNRPQLQAVPGTVSVFVVNADGTSLMNDPNDCFTFQGDWYAYVPDFGAAQIYVFDIFSENVNDYPSTLEPLITIPADSGPEIVLLTPDGKYAYCTNFSANTLSIINAASNTLVKNFTLSIFTSGPIGFAISPGLGNSMLISDYGSSNVQQYDISNRENPLFLTRYTVGANPTSIALNPFSLSSDLIAYTTNSGDNTISVINLITLTRGSFSDYTYLMTPAWIAPTPVGENSCQYTQMVLNDGNSEAYFYKNLTAANVTSPPTYMLSGFALNQPPYFPQIVASPDSTLAYVTNTQSGNISVIDIAGLPSSAPTITATIPTNPYVNGLSLTPSGQLGFAGDGTSPNKLIIFNGKSPYNDSSFEIMGGSNITNPGIQPDQCPVARAVYTLESDGMTVDFDGSGSVSPTGIIVSYFWDFGDGTTQTTTSPTVSHTYAPCSVGYTVSLTVTNSAGTSTRQTYFGQGVYNNGGPLAQYSFPVSVCPLLPPTNVSITSRRGKCRVFNTITFYAPTSGEAPDHYLIFVNPNKTKLVASIPASGSGPYEITIPANCPHTCYFLFSSAGSSVSCEYTPVCS